MDDAIERLAAIAAGQHGALTTAQALAAGLSADQLRRQLRAGVLRRVGRHTVASPFGPTGALAELAALLLDCGAAGGPAAWAAWASGPTAAALHGFDGFHLERPFHVTVLRGRNVHRVHHHVHTTIDLPALDRTTVAGVPATSATRTVVDLARHVGPKRLTIALDSALRDRLTTEDLLHRRIVELRASGRYGIPKLLAAIEGSEAMRGGHSWLERRFLELCAEAGLPRPVTQQQLGRAGGRLIRVDCRFPATPVVVELLGYRWHRTATQMARDTERVNRLQLDGHVVLQYGYDAVVNNGPDVLAEVTGVLTRFRDAGQRSVSPHPAVVTHLR